MLVFDWRATMPKTIHKKEVRLRFRKLGPRQLNIIKRELEAGLPELNRTLEELERSKFVSRKILKWQVTI